MKAYPVWADFAAATAAATAAAAAGAPGERHWYRKRTIKQQDCIKLKQGRRSNTAVIEAWAACQNNWGFAGHVLAHSAPATRS
jgi:hypothetical protein